MKRSHLQRYAQASGFDVGIPTPQPFASRKPCIYDLLIRLADCRTINELAANSPVWLIFQLRIKEWRGN